MALILGFMTLRQIRIDICDVEASRSKTKT